MQCVAEHMCRSARHAQENQEKKKIRTIVDDNAVDLVLHVNLETTRTSENNTYA